MTWGIIPAAGIGSRIQPLAFSKELLPVGSRLEAGVERPRAVGEYLIERMILGGADKDLLRDLPDQVRHHRVLRRRGRRRPDRLRRAADAGRPVRRDLPGAAAPRPRRARAHRAARHDLVPEDAPRRRSPTTAYVPVLSRRRAPALRRRRLRRDRHRASKLQVKQPGATSHWVWGAFKLPARTLAELHALWREPGRSDTYIGTLVNAWLARGGMRYAVARRHRLRRRRTLHGWRDAVHLLEREAATSARHARTVWCRASSVAARDAHRSRSQSDAKTQKREALGQAASRSAFR